MPPADAFPLRTTAPAKINWTLEVLGRRNDGYHEIRSVMQTISLADEIEIEPASELSLRVEGLGAAELAEDDNIVLRAARMFPAEFAVPPVAIHLLKRIPAAAGLGGGSSDAAAALRLLFRLWREYGGLHIQAAQLGSDVPFFIRGGTQIASGRGEHLRRLPSPAPTSLVVLTPPIQVPNKTARLYAQLTPDMYTRGEATSRFISRLRDGHAPGPDAYANVFDAVADGVFGGLGDYRRALEQVTGSRAMLAGAGPSLFAVSDRAEAAADALRRQGLAVWAVTIVGPRRGT